MINKYTVIAFSVVAAALGAAGCSDQSSNQTVSAPQVVETQVVAPDIKITNWGPQGTVSGQGFSIQPDGSSALWFEFSGAGNANNIEVWFGDNKLSGVAIIPNQGGSAQIPPELLVTPGKVPVYLMDINSGKKISLGNFEITPATY